MVEQLDLLSHVDKVTDPTVGLHRDSTSTERSAARSASLRAGSQKSRLLVLLARRGDEGALPHDVYAEAGCLYPHVASTRLLSLMQAGFVTRTGATRPAPSGEASLLWFVTDAGAAYVKENNHA